MTAQQTDWTKPLEESETYPGVLRGYRHFGDAYILRSVHAGFEYPKIEETEWWEAKCGTTESARNTQPTHPVPHSECRCGFYINYYPETSFYDKSTDASHPRGVVEASGHIILGTKGFRAQKLRLIALTPITFSLGTHVQEVFPWVKLYSSAEEMYEDYPQEDLTSLLGEDVVKRNLEPSLFAQLASQPVPDWSKYVGSSVPPSSYHISSLNPTGLRRSFQHRFPNGFEILADPAQDYLRLAIPVHACPPIYDFTNIKPTDIVMNPIRILEYRISNLKYYNIDEDTHGNMVRLTFSDYYTQVECVVDFRQGAFTLTRQRY